MAVVVRATYSLGTELPTAQYDSRSSPAGSSVQLEASPAVLSLGPKALPFAQH